MKNNRREFIKKGGALAALSLAGINPGKSVMPGPGISENNMSKKQAIFSSGEPVMKIAVQAQSEPGENERNKIFKVHLRNVNQPLPHFTETFLYGGYADVYKILKALRDVDFDGVIIADHIPSMAYGPYTGTTFSVGYMKGLVERVIAEG